MAEFLQKVDGYEEAHRAFDDMCNTWTYRMVQYINQLSFNRRFSRLEGSGAQGARGIRDFHISLCNPDHAHSISNYNINAYRAIAAHLGDRWSENIPLLNIGMGPGFFERFTNKIGHKNIISTDWTQRARMYDVWRRWSQTADQLKILTNDVYSYADNFVKFDNRTADDPKPEIALAINFDPLENVTNVEQLKNIIANIKSIEGVKTLLWTYPVIQDSIYYADWKSEVLALHFQGKTVHSGLIVREYSLQN